MAIENNSADLGHAAVDHSAVHRLLADSSDKQSSLADGLNFSVDPIASTGQSDLSDFQRYGGVIGGGLLGTVPGMLREADNLIHHPTQLLETVGTGAALGAVMKFALPEGGIYGKALGLVLTGIYAYESAPAFEEAWKMAGEAKNHEDLNLAQVKMGNAIGTVATDTVVAGVPAFLSGAAVGKFMASEAGDSIAIRKELIWHAPEKFALDHMPNWMNNILLSPEALKRSQTLSLMPKWEAKGNTSVSLDSVKAAPTDGVLADFDPETPMALSVYARSLDFTGRKLDRVNQRITDGKRGFVDDREMAEKFGADPKSVEAIKQWAASKNLSIDENSIDYRNGRMRITGTKSTMEGAFGTQFRQWEAPDGTTSRVRMLPYAVEKNMAPHFESMLGGDTRRSFNFKHTGFTPFDTPRAAAMGIANRDMSAFETAEPNATPRPKPIEASDLAKARGLPPGLTGKGKVIGIGELGGDLDLADNKVYYDDRGMKQPDIIKKGVNGTVPQSDGPNGADGEVALDTIVAGAIAPDAQQRIAFGENSDAGFPDTHNELAFPTDGAKAADVISWSWGQKEGSWTQQARRSLSMAFKRSNAKGITTFVAAGDDGALDRNVSAMVDFPASDSGVVAVGGTQVILDKNGKVVKEVAWNDGHTAAQEAVAAQSNLALTIRRKIDMPPNVTGNTFDGKGVPDTAENASPASGYIVRVGGKYGAIGGTSGAAPAWAAYTSAMSEGVGRNFGNMNYFLYAHGSAESGIFNDITQGDNNGYQSGKGWDAVTGWGSPRLTEMTELLKSDKTGNPGGRRPRFVRPTASH